MIGSFKLPQVMDLNDMLAHRFIVRVIADSGTFEDETSLIATLTELNNGGFYDTASLILTPNAFKPTKLYSIKPANGTGDFTVTRASTATRVNEQGLIETVAANVARIDYTDGNGVLLLEPQATNLALWSEQFDNAYWSKIRCTVTSNITTAPDGTLTADKLIEDTTSFSKSIRTSTISVTSGQYWHIVRLKQNGRIEAGVFDGLNSVGIYVDLVNAVFLGILIGAPDDYYVESIANGWVEVGILTTSPVSTNLVVYITVGQSVSYTGDGVSGIYIWGAEVKKNKDSYIPTTTATVTRLADDVSVDVPSGVTSITETIDGIEQTPITVIPTTYTIPYGKINKIIMK